MAQTLKKVDRGTLWSSTEITELLKSWAAEEIQEMLASTKSLKEIFLKVAANIPGRDALSCQKKIQQLRREYHKYKVRLNQSGNTSDIPLPLSIAAHFDLLDQILSDQPLTTPSTLQTGDEKGQYVGVYKPRRSSEFMVFILTVHV